MSQFRDAIGDMSRGFVSDVRPGEPLAVFFGGIIGGFGMPPFEFARFTEGLPASRFFLRDVDQCHYQRGVRGLGRSIDEVKVALANEIEAARPTRVVTIGNSAGGYAAALFGGLLDADESHAFSPQTTIATIPRLLIRDFRWFDRAHRMILRRDHRYDDLAALPLGRLTVHYSSEHRLDAAYAQRLAGHATLRAYPDRGHNLVKRLRESGELELILREALAGSQEF